MTTLQTREPRADYSLCTEGMIAKTFRPVKGGNVYVSRILTPMATRMQPPSREAPEDSFVPKARPR